MNLETSSKNISQCALKRERKRGYADIVKGRFFPLQWCAVRSSKSSKNLSTFFNYSKHKKTLRIIHWIPDRFSFYSRFFVPKSNFRIYKKKRKILFLSSRPYGIIFVTTSQLNDESELCVCNVPYKDDGEMTTLLNWLPSRNSPTSQKWISEIDSPLKSAGFLEWSKKLK